ncbi:hypothetical protein VKT23_001681 [Stygiomarasmius scandens]|uniref:Uncharacterized protein n=1 Tax=Marasmiellus scandens TaxID=2682957 RepID=A0ABR1K0Z1_9AGAR
MSPLPRSGFGILNQDSSTDSLQDVSFKLESTSLDQPPRSSQIREHRPVKSRSHPIDVMRISCVVLHLAVIAFLFYLVVLPFPASQRLGDGQVFFKQFKVHAEDSTNTQNFLRSYTAELIVSNQKTIIGGIVNGYCILLVLTTQKLALRRQLHVHNSLTTKHDTVSAWSGLGSALMTILGWKQIGFKTSLSTTFIATAYLAGILAFQSVAGGMASFQAYETNENRTINTTGVPDFTKDLGNMITGSSSLLTIRSLESFINFTGLANNGLGAIYSVPVDREQFSNLNTLALNVSARYFDVECGDVPGEVDTEDSNVFFYDFLGNNDNSTLPDLSMNMITVNSAPWGANANDLNVDMALWPPTLLVLSTVPILDSSGAFAGKVSVEPAVNYQSFDNGEQVVDQVFALACNLTVNFVNVVINPRTFGLQEFDDLSAMNKSKSTFRQFPTATRSVMNLTDNTDALISSWPFLTEIAVSPLSEYLSRGNAGLRLSETDQFVMESFDVFPDRIMSADQARNSSSKVLLHDLENTLSRMTAISMWSQVWGRNQKFAFEVNREFGDESGTVDAVTEPASLMVMVQHRFLFLNLKELYGAFALSIFLLALAAPAILDNNNLQIDSIGILQMVWLLQEHKELQEKIGQVPEPTTDDLRVAGQDTNVCFGTHHHHTLPSVP